MNRLRNVTLGSVPSLREFANDVLCDVLLYEQPMHRRVIHERIVGRRLLPREAILGREVPFEHRLPEGGGAIVHVGAALASGAAIPGFGLGLRG